MVQVFNPSPLQPGQAEVIFLDEGYNFLESQEFEPDNHLALENHACKLAEEYHTVHIVVLVRLAGYHFNSVNDGGNGN